MHFLQHLLNWMLPVPQMIFAEFEPPEGQQFVVTSTGAFVTNRANDFVTME